MPTIDLKRMLDSEEGSIIRRRHTLESRINLAKETEDSAKRLRRSLEADLEELTKECKHTEIIEKGEPWQGGGLYYQRMYCPDCGKDQHRYNRKLTIEKNKEWDKQWDRNYTDEYYEQNTPQKSGVDFGAYNW